MSGVGFLVGYSVHTNAAKFVAALLLVLLFGYSMSWVFATVGLLLGNPESAQAAAFPVMAPLVFASSAFVSVSTMPGWLQQHPLQVDAVGSLHLGDLCDRHSGNAQALGQLVADPLELPEVEQPGIAGGVGEAPEATHAVGGHERFRKRALETSDLQAERAARRALVGLGDDRRKWAHALLKKLHSGLLWWLLQLITG